VIKIKKSEKKKKKKMRKRKRKKEEKKNKLTKIIVQWNLHLGMWKSFSKAGMQVEGVDLSPLDTKRPNDT
jgi:glutamate/tyrosine decarboxylase-like PLP-dependent enzyme